MITVCAGERGVAGLSRGNRSEISPYLLMAVETNAPRWTMSVMSVQCWRTQFLILVWCGSRQSVPKWLLDASDRFLRVNDPGSEPEVMPW